LIGPIGCVTIAVPDLDRSIESYERYLGYGCTRRSRLSAEQADYLEAPALGGAACGLLQPERGSGFSFRFIEQALPTGYRALTTWGWNAAELIVRDVDGLAERLAGSPFRIAGPPEDLSFSSAIRAMQVIGPAEEVLYLTMVKEPLPGFDLPAPVCEVGRAFIVIVGGPDMARMQRYYHRQHGVPEAPVMEARVSVLSKALGLPPEQQHPIAAMPLAGQSLIEVDAYPTNTTERPRVEGGLPPAMAVVSFVADRLPDRPGGRRFTGEPYRGRPCVLDHGAAGELVELIGP
jgi:catechol 2,3-dioxygenase-like lactoylglutathione lyase family enzyme